ncbi:MAG: SBBP repeat-containing protein [Pseudomonadota bacterium]
MVLPVIIGLGIIALFLKGCSPQGYVETKGKRYKAMGDEDGDGVKNIVDLCMFKKGPNSNSGCPVPVAYEKLKEGKYYEVTRPDGGPDKATPPEKTQPDEATKPETQPPKETMPEKPNNCINGTTPATKIWTKQVGSISDDRANSVAIDKSGNIYVTGYTEGSLNGNSNAGSKDIFLIKYDSSGNKIWTRQIGSSSIDEAKSVATDKDGNIYITGYTQGGLDNNTNSGAFDIFLAKYDPSGNKLWVKQIGSEDSDVAFGISIDSSGNIYITGYTMGNLVGNQSTGSYNIFLIKHDSSGKNIWTRQFGSMSDDTSNNVALDGNGNIYLAGSTRGDLDGNKNMGISDIFLTKRDFYGNRLWTKMLGSSYTDYGESLAIGKSGNIYVTGFAGDDLGEKTYMGDGDIFLAKYDPSGNRLWTRMLGSTAGDIAYGITLDQNENIYLTGKTSGNLDGNKNTGNEDIFLVKYDPSGKKFWTKQIGSKDSDIASSVAIDKSGNIYLSGYTNGALDGNANIGAYDLFLMKFECN